MFLVSFTCTMGYCELCTATLLDGFLFFCLEDKSLKCYRPSLYSVAVMDMFP